MKAKYLPGYDTYREMAEEKLQPKVKIFPTRVHYSDGRNIGNRRTSWSRIKTETAWCFFPKYRKRIKDVFC
jgi:hypothetical protein